MSGEGTFLLIASIKAESTDTADASRWRLQRRWVQLSDSGSERVTQIRNSFEHNKEYVYRVWDSLTGSLKDMQIKLFCQQETEQEIITTQTARKTITEPYGTCDIVFDETETRDRFILRVKLKMELEKGFAQIKSQKSRTPERTDGDAIKAITPISSAGDSMSLYSRQNEVHQRLLNFTNSLLKELGSEPVVAPVYTLKEAKQLSPVNIFSNYKPQSLEGKIRKRREAYANRQEDQSGELSSKQFSRVTTRPELNEKKSQNDEYRKGENEYGKFASNITSSVQTPSHSFLETKLDILRDKRRKRMSMRQQFPQEISREDISKEEQMSNSPGKTEPLERKGTDQILPRIHPLPLREKIVSFHIRNIRAKMYNDNLKPGKLVRIESEAKSYQTHVLISAETSFEWIDTNFIFDKLSTSSALFFEVLTCDETSRLIVGQVHLKVSDFYDYCDANAYKIYLTDLNSIVGYLQFDFKFADSGQEAKPKPSVAPFEPEYVLPKLKMSPIGPEVAVPREYPIRKLRVKSENRQFLKSKGKKKQMKTVVADQPSSAAQYLNKLKYGKRECLCGRRNRPNHCLHCGS